MATRLLAEQTEAYCLSARPSATRRAWKGRKCSFDNVRHAGWQITFPDVRPWHLRGK